MHDTAVAHILKEYDVATHSVTARIGVSLKAHYGYKGEMHPAWTQPDSPFLIWYFVWLPIWGEPRSDNNKWKRVISFFLKPLSLQMVHGCGNVGDTLFPLHAL